jgi:hypothetical protein
MTETPSRQQWRGQYVAKHAPVKVQRVTAFGWVVHRHIMPMGSVLITRATKEIDRASAPNLTLYVRGQASFTHESGQEYDNRVPGMYSGDRPSSPVGSCRHDPIEELEFWCFNWHANRGALPVVEILRAPQASVFEADVGQRVLLCAGRLGQHVAPCSFIHDGEPLVATVDSYGFLIGGDRV